MKRKMTRMTAVKISFRRRSGRFQAPSSALSIALAAFGRLVAPSLLGGAALRLHVDVARRLAVSDRDVASVDRPPLAARLLDAELVGRAAGRLDLLAGALRELVDGHGQRDGKL